MINNSSMNIQQQVFLVPDTLGINQVNSLGAGDNFSNRQSKDSLTHIPLKKWIKHALESASLSSDNFLLPSLKIAHSLAEKCCEAGGSDTNNRRTRLPAPGSDWADQVVVQLSQPSENQPQNLKGLDETLDFQPLPFALDKLQSDSQDVQDVFNLVNHEQRSEGNQGFCVSKNDSSNYTIIENAKFLPSLIGSGSDSLLNSNTKIYYLGILFYELFSGGKQPQSSNNSSELDDDLYTPLCSVETNAIDFDGALHILDELGGDDDLYEKNNGISSSGPAQHRKKQAFWGSSVTPPEGENGPLFSVEQLRSDGVPAPLCDLIANMIDCGNGDVKNEESYNHMVDVVSDLQMMMNDPNRFLREVDVANLSVTGLQLDNTLFGRESEISTLQDTYQRSISGESELAIISGSSGTGKSMLANRLASHIKLKGGIFLSGKFDQLKQAKPFSAITTAFNEYCNHFQPGSDRALEVASMLRMALGPEVYHVMKIIPSLFNIVGQDAGVYGYLEQQECVDAQKRLQYLLCKFVEVISNSSAAPVTLFLDDLQWADAASIAVIHQLLLNSGSSSHQKHFFFLGCCRDDEMSDDHPVWTMISGIQHFQVRATIVKLSCMGADETNKTVSNILRLSPRLTRPLSDIVHHKTKGNPLFFSRMMVSLNNEGLLRLSLSRRRWEWKIESIQSRELPEDVAVFFTNTIGKLPKEVQLALCVLSCFGRETDSAVLKKLEDNLEMNLISPLDFGVKEGLLDKQDNVYCFVHDRVQEAAYNKMKPEERPLYHYKYGLALSTNLVGNDHDVPLFTAVGQINRGGPSAVSNAEEGVVAANLNLIAGRKAMTMSDFASAFWFFDNGISFLPKKHWKLYYDLSLQLFESAAQCALAIADFDSLHLLSEQVMRNARSFEEKLNILFITVSALAYASGLPQSVEKSISVLSQLGEHLPTSFTESDVINEIEQTRTILSAFDDDDLLQFKSMTDPSKIVAMKFLTRLQSWTMMIRPMMQPLFIVKMVQLSLSHGFTSMSPIGFAYYGGLLAKLGFIREGYRFVKIAKKLLSTLGSKEIAGEVFMISTHVSCFVEPGQTTNDFFLEGFDLAMAAGDTTNAITNKLFYVCNLFWMGCCNLKEAKKKFTEAIHFMEQHNNLTFLTYMTPLDSVISMLVGDADIPDTFYPSDLSFTQSKMELDHLKKNPHKSKVFYLHKMNVTFIFRRFNEMKCFAENYFELGGNAWILLFPYSMYTFIYGLVSFWIFRETRDPVWAERGCEALSAMSLWASNSSWNFSNKKLILEAEKSFCERNFESARAFYDQAICASKEHRFIHEEALACELAGYFFLDFGRTDTSVEYFTRAHERYHEWGAIKKATLLYAHVENIVTSSVRNPTASPENRLPLSSFQVPQEDPIKNETRKRAAISEETLLQLQSL